MKRNFHVLVVRNKLQVGMESELERFKNWVEKYTPLKVSIDFTDTSLPLKWKDFGVVVRGGDVGNITQTSWGLDGIKAQLRNVGIPEFGAYDSVIFLYDMEGFPTDKVIGTWCYYEGLQDAVFIESPATKGSLRFDITRVLSHEICHAFMRILWWNNIPKVDDMDLYDKEFCEECPDGNRMRNLARISDSEWGLIGELPVKRGLIEILFGWLFRLQEQARVAQPPVRPIPEPVPVPTPPPPAPSKESRINEWARLIYKYEGFYPGSRSWRNNSPGNLKVFGSYVRSMPGYIGMDEAGFARFATFEDGLNALCQLLRDACNGLLKNQKPDWTLQEFFAGRMDPVTKKPYGGYAPANDSNEPNAYSLFVARGLKVEPTIQIKELL